MPSKGLRSKPCPYEDEHPLLASYLDDVEQEVITKCEKAVTAHRLYRTCQHIRPRPGIINLALLELKAMRHTAIENDKDGGYSLCDKKLYHSEIEKILNGPHYEKLYEWLKTFLVRRFLDVSYTHFLTHP